MRTPQPPIVSVNDVTIRYAVDAPPVLRSVNVGLDEGDLAVVIGRTGSGKSTLLGAMTGAMPHFTGGLLSGQVIIDGRDTRTHRPRDLADVVGVVGQDPLAGFVTDTVEEELAYAMEQLGLPGAVMRRRVEETLDLLGIADLRGAALHELSGGQQQRVAIGSVLTAHPRVIVLDEPTSALDPTAAEEVLATLTRLAHDLAVTVIVAEHRIERVLPYADTVLHVGTGGVVTQGSPAEVLLDSEVAPPIVQLGRAAGWRPLPLSIREGRRAAADLRADLQRTIGTVATEGTDVSPAGPPGSRDITPRLFTQDLVVRHGPVTALAGVSFEPRAGEVTVLMGRNGAGKSTLLWALQGAQTPSAGSVHLSEAPGHLLSPSDLKPASRRQHVVLVPQSASDLLYLDSVEAECAAADLDRGHGLGHARSLLEALAPGIDPSAHPRDLSEGQRLALVLAVQLGQGSFRLLDEPTRGLDYAGKDALVSLLRSMAGSGTGVVVATHDVEFAALVADRVVILAGGEVIADGPATDILTSSPSFAPQIAKITMPGPWLTVTDVLTALPALRGPDAAGEGPAHGIPTAGGV